MEEKNIEIANKPDKEFWVWMLIDEDITEWERSETLWADKEKAKAAMEESIREVTSLWKDEGLELIREDEDHVSFGERERWTIVKKRVHV